MVSERFCASCAPWGFPCGYRIVSQWTSRLMVNKAFSLEIFPDSLKIAKAVPIHKSEDKHNPSNYRPIFLLTCFTKIFEKLIFTRLDSFICKHSIVASTQYGFRRGRSTMHIGGGTGGALIPHFFSGAALGGPNLRVCFYNITFCMNVAYLKLNRPTFEIKTQERA